MGRGKGAVGSEGPVRAQKAQGGCIQVWQACCSVSHLRRAGGISLVPLGQGERALSSGACASLGGLCLLQLPQESQASLKWIF